MLYRLISALFQVLLARHGKSHSLSPSNVNYRANIHALKLLDCTHVIATTATGSLKQEIEPGQIVILSDFIDQTKRRVTTFYDGSETSGVGVWMTLSLYIISDLYSIRFFF